MNSLNRHGLTKLVEYLEKCAPGISQHLIISDDCLMIENVVLVAFTDIVEDMPVKPVQVTPGTQPNSILNQVQNKLQPQSGQPNQNMQQVNPLLQKQLKDLNQKVDAIANPAKPSITKPGLDPAQRPANDPSQDIKKVDPIQQLQQPNAPNAPPQKQAQAQNSKHLATDILSSIGTQLRKVR